MQQLRQVGAIKIEIAGASAAARADASARTGACTGASGGCVTVDGASVDDAAVGCAGAADVVGPLFADAAGYVRASFL